MSVIDARIGSMIAGYRVALKLLAPELAHDERFRERFLRESRLAASFDHPNIVPIYDADQADGVLYIAMRWVQGTDLRELLRRAVTTGYGLVWVGTVQPGTARFEP